MTSRDMDRAGNGRRRFGSNPLEARNAQAARDALRRRQKEKKARIVKRHVRYKQKQKLLQQLELTERATPIVAAELCRSDDDLSEESGRDQIKKAKRKKGTTEEEDSIKGTDGDHTKEPEEVLNTDLPEPVADLLPLRTNKADEITTRDDSTSGHVSGKKKVYIPFMKEQRVFQKIKEAREARDREQQKKIEEREKMLRKSKKERRAKTKQVRKVTARGQPKLKYRLDAMIARIEKQ